MDHQVQHSVCIINLFKYTICHVTYIAMVNSLLYSGLGLTTKAPTMSPSSQTPTDVYGISGMLCHVFFCRKYIFTSLLSLYEFPQPHHARWLLILGLLSPFLFSLCCILFINEHVPSNSLLYHNNILIHSF